MGRITRAKAAELSEMLHVDEDTVLNPLDACINKPQTMIDNSRTPLSEIAHNRSNTTNEPISDVSDATSIKGKKRTGQKDAKYSNKNKTNVGSGADTATETEPCSNIIPDDQVLPPSPASQSASEDLMKDVPELDMSHMPTHDIKRASPSSNAIRLTRNQLRKENFHVSTSNSDFTQTSDELAIITPNINQGSDHDQCDTERTNDSLDPLNDSTVLAVLDETSNCAQQLDDTSSGSGENLTNGGETQLIRIATEQAIETMQSTLGEPVTTYDELEAAAIEAQTPPRSSRSSSATTSPTSVSDAASQSNEIMTGEIEDSPTKSKSQKPLPIVRTTKASQARIALAHGPKDKQQAPSLGPPPAPGKRITSTSSTMSTDSVEKKEIIIPHSKPRPMSMAFPVPPPPPKSNKAPTQSNFQLPGEAIAAKLKAAKEARLQKEAAEQLTKRTFKARPVPASHAKGAAVRHTSTSKARESLISASADPATHQRANSVATMRSSSSNPVPDRPTTTTSQSKPTIRPSTAMASNPTVVGPVTTSKKTRSDSVVSTSRPASTVPGAVSGLTASKPVTATVKGREVYNRHAQAKEAAEREKREKEDAARKARAEAAERGRVASREWAEKQRLQKLGVTTS